MTTGSEKARATEPVPAPDGARANDLHVAAALKSAYDETVRESVPAEFLDLLGKLA